MKCVQCFAYSIKNVAVKFLFDVSHDIMRGLQVEESFLYYSHSISVQPDPTQPVDYDTFLSRPA